MLSTLVTAAFFGIETSVNQLLKLDGAAQSQLSSLDQHCFFIECTQPSIKCYLLIENNKLRFMQHYEGNISSELSGSLTDFVAVLQQDDIASSLINSPIQFSGKTEPLIELQNILKNIDLDWELLLTPLLGDSISHAVGKTVRKGVNFQKQLLNNTKEYTRDYIHEEARLSPSQAELNDYYQDISHLRERSDRLHAKLNALAQQIKQRSTK